MLFNTNWRIRAFKSIIGVKGKIAVLIFYFMQVITYPFWMITKFDYYKLFFISNVLLKNKDGTFYCRKRSWDFWHVREDYEKEIRKQFNIKNGIFIDIGAHVGKYTIMIGRKVGKKGMVIAIEPETYNFIGLLENIKLNKLTNVIPIKLALSNKSGNAKLFVTDEYGGGGHSIIEHNKKSTFRWVASQTLDNLLKKIKIKPKHVKLVKIDVEGAEYLVLKGAKNFLKETNAKIIFEAKTKDRLKKITNFLKKYNYYVSHASGENYIAIKSK